MRLGWLALGLIGCVSRGTLGGDDVDGDRYGAEEDCDDNDATAHPGGVEVCDGADNDCDGTIDEEVGTPVFPDVDGDGYGDAASPTPACGEPPAGFVTNGEDCDDTDRGVRPGVPEACDGIDNDCDGRPDWGLRVPADFARIQDAIGASSAGDHVCVSPGTYVETVDFAGRAVVVEGVGGAEVTTIDGGGLGPVVSFDTREGAGTRLTGFTITGGDSYDGAGVYVRGATPTLDHLIITGNQCTAADSGCRGVGVYVERAVVEITDSVISENVSKSTYTYYPTNQGAGLFFGTAASVTLRRVTVAGNRAEVPEGSYYGLNYGAGIYAGSGTLTLEDVDIVGNVADGPSNSTYSYGGGLYGTSTDVIATGATFADNTADGYAGQGAGMYLYYTEAWLTNVVVAKNHAGGRDATTATGGGIESVYAFLDVENCDVVGNDTQGATTSRGGGLDLVYYGTMTMKNTSVAYNRATSGGAFGADAGQPYSTVTIGWSNFYDNGAGAFSTFADPGTGNGNLAADPRYTSTSGAGADWDLGLGAGSPLIDAGDPEILDQDGSRSDIGSRGGPG